MVQELRNIGKILVQKGVVLSRQSHNRINGVSPLCRSNSLRRQYILQPSLYSASIGLALIGAVIVGVIRSAVSIVFSSQSARVKTLSLSAAGNSDWVYFQSFCF